MGSRVKASPPTGFWSDTLESEISIVHTPDEAVVPWTSAVHVPRRSTGVEMAGAELAVAEAVGPAVGPGTSPVALQAAATNASSRMVADELRPSM